MPRYRIRTIKPELYSDERIQAVPLPARLTAIGLISYADDRGRGQMLVSQIKGLIHPGEDVTEKQVARHLEEIIATGFALLYVVAPSRYLWLPKFWHHQVINKPSESRFPAHPEDPYGHLPITEALQKFREDSRSGTVVLPPSRAGSKVPFLSCSTPSTNDKGFSSPAREPYATFLSKAPAGAPSRPAANGNGTSQPPTVAGDETYEHARARRAAALRAAITNRQEQQ